MVNEVRFSCEDVAPERCFAEMGQDKVLDLHLHACVPVARERATERRLELHRINSEGIRSSRVFVVTLGLIEVWYDTLNKVFINAMPEVRLTKREPERFLFRVMSPAEAMQTVDEIVTTIGRYARPDHKIILTVSPVPLRRTFTDQDAMSANMYSKSCLRVAAEMTARKFDHVDYFPSFETVLYSNREKTWLDDFMHVTNGMVAHNVKRLTEYYT
nr:GSCFA domain-containing protein [Propylenella binzhouense]